MSKVTAQEYAEKHARRLKASTEDIRRGLERVTVSPTQQAANKIDKMKANLDAAFADGRVKAGLQSVSLDAWKNAAINKGVNRIAAGIDAVRAQQEQMASKLLAAVDGATAKVRLMPDTTLDDNIARMSTYAREMAKNKGKI